MADPVKPTVATKPTDKPRKKREAGDPRFKFQLEQARQAKRLASLITSRLADGETLPEEVSQGLGMFVANASTWALAE